MSKLFTPEQWESFKWRVWNTLKSIILPIVLGTILVTLQDSGDFTGLADSQVWVNMAYAVVVALLGSGLAGLEKVTRMKTAVNVEQERVGDLKK